MGHIFISYSHKDTEYAHALADHLQEQGFEVWIDERLDYGAQWPQELQRQLDGCSAFILIMSPRSYGSEWVQSELQRARRKSKPIFPLLLEGEESWLSVESTQYYDVRGNLYPDAKFYSNLKKALAPTPIRQTPQTSKATVRSARPSWKTRTTIMVAGLFSVAFLACVGLLATTIFPIQLKPQTTEVKSEPEMIASKVATLSVEPTSTFTKSVVASQTPLPVPITGAHDKDMALVPAGEFPMGRKASEELADCQKFFNSGCELSWFLDEEPVSTIYLDAFYIDIYEVTNALYKTCETAGVCDPPGDFISNTHLNYYGNPEFDNYPVIFVNWNQARTFCEWQGKRLPTEAEWEKAARGTDGRIYPWGNEPNEIYANFHWNVGDTTAVGSYEDGKSPYGLYDMAGNVWEWVSSLYAPYPYDPNDGREDLRNKDQRLMRGGSWGFDGDNSVSASYRFASDPTAAKLDLGFRCASNAAP